jgi:uncharacterized protein YdiU (UPF0061 family)
MGTTQKNLIKKSESKKYTKFHQIDGRHPLQKECPDSFISYRARKRHGGKVAFFNFDLAKEMGIIPKSHPNEMNPELEQKILDTFSIVIINEYDIINNIQFPEDDILPHPFMATRYLQLQHPNKQGKTSGDGRSIWNGQVKHGGKSWDISSCGTGATRLSPATHIQNKYFQTGDPTISYGCGYSEIDEGLATLFFSEILRRNRHQTERVLGIIEFKKGISINIRAHENLLRPSHMFNHLKQANYDGLSDIVNFYIDRQVGNKVWDNIPKTKNARYRYFVDKQIEVFANLSADFEDDYIFCWLDWDGDNILMDGGIIDYGSIRQFGLFHHEYRFDDVQRYSTSIKEQRDKAKLIAKTFVQIADYLMTGERKPLNSFSNHKGMKSFDKLFEKRKNENFLRKIGLTDQEISYLTASQEKFVVDFRKVFSYFERAKSVEGLHAVADGINWNAIFCMRDILREMPQIYLHREGSLEREEFIDIIKSTYATAEDLEITNYRAKKIDEFQDYYWKLVHKLAKKFNKDISDILLQITMRSSVINKYDRVTGDSITNIVDKVMKRRPRLKANELFQIMHEFSEYQNLDPDNKRSVKVKNSEHSKMMRGMLKIVREFREGI